jgi:hypothetical protein
MKGCRRVCRLVAQRQVQHRVPKGQKVLRGVRKARRWVQKVKCRPVRLRWVLLIPTLGVLVLPSPLEILLLADSMEWGSGCRGAGEVEGGTAAFKTCASFV